MTDIKPKKATLATGFGGSYEANIDPLSIDKLVNQVPSATFYMRVEGDNKGAELGNGDVAVVDRSLEPRTDSIIVTTVDSELVIRRYVEKDEVIELYRDSEEPSEILAKEDFELWGVVTYSLKNHKVTSE
jgi:DNA polymerase V